MAQAPDFWQLVDRHKDVLTSMINQRADRVLRELKFLVNYPEILPLEPRIKLFRSVQSRKLGDEITLRVRREHILQDSFNKLRSIGYKKLNGRLLIKYQNERAIDMGGPLRDWFCSIITELFNPHYALFIPSSNNRSNQPNPSSYVNPHANDYFEFAGAVLALALLHGICVPAHLTRALLKHLLGQSMTLRDLEDVDEELHRSLVWIMHNNIEGLELQFTADYDDLGSHVLIELKEGGSDIEVTEETKQEYVKLMIDHRLNSQIRQQINAFRRGFYTLIPQEEIKMFKPDELDLLICGVPEIDVDDMQRNTVYEGRYNANTPVIRYFFNVVRGFDKEQRAKLLLFMTGSSQVPVGGFAALVESRSPLSITSDPCREHLPSAHTCTNQLVLPNYQSEEELRTKLLKALMECSGFGFA